MMTTTRLNRIRDSMRVVLAVTAGALGACTAVAAAAITVAARAL